jgi:hypothetical protein
MVHPLPFGSDHFKTSHLAANPALVATGEFLAAMKGLFATRIFRIVFVLAGCYNLAFGLWAGFYPLHFFEIFDIPPPLYPAIWSCLGMVVGVYGLLYWYAAWKPDNARPIIAVGLLGKVLGPVGMALNISQQWPARLGMLCVYNDVIWWLPFSLFLLRGTSLARRLANWPPFLCAAIHTLGVLAILLLLRPGLQTQPDVIQRATYIAEHSAVWSIGWVTWMLCALSLILFYAWWGCRLIRPIIATIAVLLTGFGSVCDLSSEAFSSVAQVELARQAIADPSKFDSARFTARENYTVLLTAGAANFLYVVAGILLTWSTKNLPRPIALAMWATWIAGLWMTLAACLGHVPGIYASTAITIPLLICWTQWMGLRWRPL